jgi:hypothetical protein
MKYIVLVLALVLSGCVSYSKVERTTVAGEKCRAVARGYFFTFQTPGVVEECRDQEDR